MYNRLMRNLATRAKPDGGALEAVISSFISKIDHENADSKLDLKAAIRGVRLEPLMEMVHCYDFVKVI